MHYKQEGSAVVINRVANRKHETTADGNDATKAETRGMETTIHPQR
jgi:hypothetical protein